MTQRHPRIPYIIEVFDPFAGWLFVDAKANEDTANIAADVTAKSRKLKMRIIHAGLVINEYDYRKENNLTMPRKRRRKKT